MTLQHACKSQPAKTCPAQAWMSALFCGESHTNLFVLRRIVPALWFYCAIMHGVSCQSHNKLTIHPAFDSAVNCTAYFLMFMYIASRLWLVIRIWNTESELNTNSGRRWVYYPETKYRKAKFHTLGKNWQKMSDKPFRTSKEVLRRIYENWVDDIWSLSASSWAWVSSNSPTLAVGSRKAGKYPTLSV